MNNCTFTIDKKEYDYDGLRSHLLDGGLEKLLPDFQLKPESQHIERKSLEQLSAENKSTTPKIPAPKVFHNEVQSLTREESKGLDAIIDAGKENELPTEKVNVKDIVPTQKNLTIPNLEKVADIPDSAQKSEPIILAKKGDQYYVADGHHRIADSILNGETSVSAKIYDIAQPKAEAVKPDVKEPWQLTKNEFEQGDNIGHHGTDADFDIFDINHSKKWDKFGLWFATDKAFTEQFGDNVKSAKLKIDNPKTISADAWNKIRDAHAKDTDWFRNWKQDLISQGYDGLKIEGKKEKFAGHDVEQPVQLAAFDNAQIITHKQVVRDALADGKTVPPEVLADYPDLRAESTAKSIDSGETKVAPADILAKSEELVNDHIQQRTSPQSANNERPLAQEGADRKGRTGDPGNKLDARENGNGKPDAQAADVQDEQKLTSTKNAVVDAEREQRKLSPIEKEAKRSFGTAWDDAQKQLQDDPAKADNLVKELQDKPRALTDTENALLLHKRIQAKTAYDDAAKAVTEAFEGKDDTKTLQARAELARASDELLDVDKASTNAGTESGRSLSARRMMANDDYTLANLETRKRAANGGRPLTDVERATLEKVANDYKAKSEALEATLKERENDLASMKAELGETRHEQNKSRAVIDKAERIAKALNVRAESARARLAKRGNVFTAGLDPLALKDLAEIGASHIANGAVDLAKFTDKMVSEFGEKIRPHIDDIFEKANGYLANSNVLKDAQREKTFINYREKRIAELTDRIEKQDFTKKPRPQALELSNKAKQLQLDLNRIKRKYEGELIKDQMRNRTKSEKAQDFVANWARFSFLSWPSTIAKLASAAAQRAIYAPIEETIGGAYSKVFKGLAKQSPSEAGLNVKAEAKTFTSGLWEGMKEAGRLLKGQDKNTNLLYGKREFMPPSNKVDAVMNYFGTIHGALKAPVEQMGFRRSFEKRTAFAIKNGVDVSDPIIQMELGMSALKDAKRQIFMQDNRVVNAYKSLIRTLEAPKPGTGKPSVAGKLAATAAKVIFPVVKIPTNIAGEIVQYATGLASGSVKLAQAYRKGIENLEPEEADAIMRQLKKGTVGPALILLGYFNPNAIGGYYQPGQKRDDKDVKFGSIKVFGVNVPSLLLHNPATEMLQIGATIRRVADSKFKKSDEESRGLLAGMIQASTGVAEEVPFVKQTVDMAKALDPRQRDEFVDEFIKSRAVPGISQWTANQLDKDSDGNTIKRKPESLFQHIESGIPGLRQNVREKGVAGIADKMSNDELKKNSEYKHATTDDLVSTIKTMRAEKRDTKAMEANLQEKAANANKGGTLTPDEIESIKSVMPDFDIAPKQPKEAKKPSALKAPGLKGFKIPKL